MRAPARSAAAQPPARWRTPRMQRHDLGIRGAFGALGWSLQALNLGDDRIEQFNGYPTPGRRWLLSLNYPDTTSTVAGRARAAGHLTTEAPTEGE